MKPRTMMATKAIHKLGDISRDGPDYCVVFSEDDENFIGNWIEGFGFMDVKFPKATTRELTAEEREIADRKFRPENFRINGQRLV